MSRRPGHSPDVQKPGEESLAELSRDRFEDQRERQWSGEDSRTISGRLSQAVEEERRRLAREIHDECGYILTALQLEIAGLEQLLPSGEEFSPRIRKLTHLVEKMRDHLQDITVALRPPALLEASGLSSVLRDHVRQMSERVRGCRFDFQVEGLDMRQTSDVELALFRICQEALSNIARHAKASEAVIRLTTGTEKVRLIIEDNGIGFDRPEENFGLGLSGMRERVASLGGELKIVSSRGKGTNVQVEIPAGKD